MRDGEEEEAGLFFPMAAGVKYELRENKVSWRIFF